MIEVIRKAWRDNLFSQHDWRISRKRDLKQGILNGVWLESGNDADAPYGAYFKPTCKCPYPAAAREKIAADLAYDLSVPAVPVLLCDGGARLHAEQVECCVSLVTHAQCHPWTWALEAIAGTPLEQEMRRASAEPLSRMVVFDIWIGNPDRDNDGNLLYCEGDGGVLGEGFRALDHSAAMGGVKQSWRNGGWSNVSATPFPAPMRSILDKSSMLRMVSDIESFSEEQIRACISRIPDRYMDESTRNDMVNGLVGRKSHLAALVLQYQLEG